MKWLKYLLKPLKTADPTAENPRVKTGDKMNEKSVKLFETAASTAELTDRLNVYHLHRFGVSPFDPIFNTPNQSITCEWCFLFDMSTCLGEENNWPRCRKMQKRIKSFRLLQKLLLMYEAAEDKTTWLGTLFTHFYCAYFSQKKARGEM